MSREILQNIINDFETERFVRFFREKNRSFAPKREDLIQYEDNDFKNGLKLGEIKFNSGEQMFVCAFRANQPLSERSGKKSQYEKAKKILKETQSDAGIFIFYDRQNNFRFSLIYANYLGTRRDWSNFRRFTYLVSKEFTNKTFLQRIGDGDFSSLEKIKDAFSVEKVTKSFYTDIANWYFWAVQNSKFPEDAKNEDNGRNIAIIRMITRLIFIWFMREKGLIGKDLFDCQNISELLKDLSPKKTTYYKAILQNLFFATLNTRIKDRKFRFKITGWKNSNYMDHRVYRYEDHFKNQEDMLKIFKDIPFLNGGLFDCLDRKIEEAGRNIEIRIDGFSDKEKGLNVPNFLFFSGEKDVDLNKEYGTKNKKYKVRGLIDTLFSYNFTIDENEPNDQEVALDPELLGKVFENLLASFNPETASTARKATGSYYTPREIVNYMVEQSLKEYFKTKLSDISELDKKLNHLFSYADETNPFNEEETNILIHAINTLKVIDPAVGSGAFPMGILQKLVLVLSKLDPHNEKWKQQQIDGIEKNVLDVTSKRDSIQKIEQNFKQNELDYGRKLYLIKKSIYGVDIQPIAIQIAKLRFFISLLVDEKVDKRILDNHHSVIASDRRERGNLVGEDNFGIEPLPNLETKLVSANSLIGLEEEKQLIFTDPRIDTLEKELKENRDKYFDASYTKEKEKLRKKDKEIRQKLAVLLKQNNFSTKNTERITNWDPYNSNISADWFDSEWMFGVKNPSPPVGEGKDEGGFDIVIGNPPYGFRDVLSSEEKQFFRKTMKIEFPTGNIAELFIIISLSKFVGQNGILTFIIPKKSLYGESWSNVRKIWLENSLCFLIDASQSFENVLLEQSVFSVQKRNSTDGNITVGALDPDAGTVRVFGEFPLANVFTPDLRNAQIYRGLYPVSLLKKIIEKSIPDTSSVIKAEIGISNITEHLTFEAEDNCPCVKGIDIVCYGLKPTIRYLNGKIAKQYIGDYQDDKIVSQEIIAHIQNPRPHILITMFYDNKRRLINDTCVEIKVPDGKLRKKFLLGYLQSQFSNWYAYNFVYNRAVRTMHFIDYYITQIPIPKCTLDEPEQQTPIIKLVDKILAITKDDDYLTNSTKQAKVKEYQHQIDQMVYKLYGLTKEEIKIVEGEDTYDKKN